MMPAGNRFNGAVAVLVICAFLAPGCGKKAEEKTAEKMMEKALSGATGKETKVDLQKGNVRIESKDMQTDIVSTSTCPPDMFADVPQFTGGAIERVVTSNEGGMKKFNIYFNGLSAEAIKQYAEALKSKGWGVDHMHIDKAGMLNATKGNLGINFAYSTEDKKDGMLAVFSTP
ncbi:MAG: hypothetical protein ABFD81_16285 [Syntrophaceae bacterium]